MENEHALAIPTQEYAPAMLTDAPPDQVSRWFSVPADRCWYSLADPCFHPSEACGGSAAWQNLSAGHRHWKACMLPPASYFASLLRIFGVEAYCSLCASSQGIASFEGHSTSQQHYHNVLQVVDGPGEAAGALWHETCVPGGLVRYNHLNGELQVFREPVEPEMPIVKLQDIPSGGVWQLVGAPACTATCAGGDKDTWPNLWSNRHWKEKMKRSSKIIAQALQACGDPYGANCSLCQIAISAEHLSGPKHVSEVVRRVPQIPESVSVEPFWQTWTFPQGAIAYNHLDGTARMIRKPSETEEVQEAAAAAAPSSSASSNLLAQNHGTPTDDTSDSRRPASPSEVEDVARMPALTVKPPPPSVEHARTERPPPPPVDCARTERPPPPPVECGRTEGKPPPPPAAECPARTVEKKPPPPKEPRPRGSVALGSPWQLPLQQSSRDGCTSSTSPPALHEESQPACSPWKLPLQSDGDSASSSTETPLTVSSRATSEQLRRAPASSHPHPERNLCDWLWRHHASRLACDLERKLNAIGVPQSARICSLCGDQEMHEGIEAHLSCAAHFGRVQDLFVAEGTSSSDWWQTWPGVARVNHLTLDVTDAKPIGCVSSTATAPIDRAAHEAEVPLAEDSNWEAYMDPDSNSVWYHNARTGEATWSENTAADFEAANRRQGIGDTASKTTATLDKGNPSSGGKVAVWV